MRAKDTRHTDLQTDAESGNEDVFLANERCTRRFSGSERCRAGGARRFMVADGAGCQVALKHQASRSKLQMRKVLVRLHLAAILLEAEILQVTMAGI